VLPADPRDGLAFSTSVARTLWPTCSVRVGRAGGARKRAWWLFPHPRRVRLVLPARRPHATAILHASARGRQSATRSAMQAGAMLARIPGVVENAPALIVEAGNCSRDDDTADVALSRVVGESVFVSWAVGPRRANRKPVLQLSTHQAKTIGFAKAGIDDLTRVLVGKEAGALQALSRHHFTVLNHPVVLGRTWVRDTQLLAISSIDSDGASLRDTLGRAGAARRHLLHQAMTELATAQGVNQQAIGSSAWLERLERRIQSVPDRVRQRRLSEAVTPLRTLTRRLPFGSWHGDWQPANFAIHDSSVAVWDWERYEQDVPLGFDSQHLALQTAITQMQVPPRDAASWALESARQRLAPWSISAEDARVVAILHLFDVSVRYIVDRQYDAGADIADVEHWALPLASRELRALADSER